MDLKTWNIPEFGGIYLSNNSIELFILGSRLVWNIFGKYIMRWLNILWPKGEDINLSIYSYEPKLENSEWNLNDRGDYFEMMDLFFQPSNDSLLPFRSFRSGPE